MAELSKKNNPVIVIDPGHGATQASDDFRVGPTGEREEWINLRVAELLAPLLEQEGFEVHLTRDADVEVSQAARAQVALDVNADVFVSVHHNSTFPPDRTVDYPLVFVRGDVNAQNNHTLLARCLLDSFVAERGIDGVMVSDHIILDTGLGVLGLLNEHTAAVFGEFSFFSHPEEEQRLKSQEYCLREARCYVQAIKRFKAERIQHVATEHIEFLPQDLRERIECNKPEVFSDQENWLYHKQQGDHCFKRDEWAAAIESYEQSLGLLLNNPQAKVVYERLAKCYEQLDDAKQSTHYANMATYGVTPVCV